MPKNRYIRFVLLAVGALLFASCQKDGEFRNAEHGALSVNVTVTGFSSGNTGTRASETNYTTTFTGGDKIGITVMRTEGPVVILEDNIPYEYDGSSWNPLNTADAVHRYPQADVVYLVYYPYSAAMDGVKSTDEIFAAFTPKSDQSSYADYTSSDLMTGTGTLSGGSLGVTLNHALSLVEINLFTGSSGVTLKVDDMDFIPYNVDGATWRCIIKPTEEATLSGQYALSGISQSWQKEDKTLVSGTYARINIINSFYIGNVNVNYADGGSETVQYDLSIGGITVRQDEIIESIELPDANGKIHLIGRSTSGELNLIIHGNGNLLFRPADSDGYIPIGSYAEFQLLNTVPDALNGNYRQESDLNLMDVSWAPIGNENAPFGGIYNGDGHTIANLQIDMDATDNVGLFGVMDGNHPEVNNLHIISGNIKGNANVGGICGANYYGAISLCSNAASIEGTGYNVGGIAGINDFGNITASGNMGTVIGGNNVGGLVGNNIGEIIACCNTGVITGDDAVGGITGINDTGAVNACYNTSAITGNNCVGGLVGFNTGPLVGDDPEDEPSIEDAGIVISCYNTGTVTGTDSVAGLSGLNAGQVMACYWLSGTAGVGVNNSLDNPDLPGIDIDVTDFTLPPGFIPDAVTYPSWETGDGSDEIGNWKNYDGNGGLPQLWWEN